MRKLWTSASLALLTAIAAGCGRPPEPSAGQPVGGSVRPIISVVEFAAVKPDDEAWTSLASRVVVEELCRSGGGKWDVVFASGPASAPSVREMSQAIALGRRIRASQVVFGSVDAIVADRGGDGVRQQYCRVTMNFSRADVASGGTAGAMACTREYDSAKAPPGRGHGRAEAIVLDLIRQCAREFAASVGQ